MKKAALWIAAALFALAQGSGILYLEIKGLRYASDKIDRYQTIAQAEALVLKDPSVNASWQNLRVTYLDYEAVGYGCEWLERYGKKSGEAEAWYSIGWLHEQQDELKEALEYYDKALKIKPTHDRALINSALICRKKGDLQRAKEMTLLATATRPEYARWWYNLGVVNHEMDLLDQAKEAYWKAHELDPADPDTLYNLGLLYEEQKDARAAYEAYEKLTRYCPSYVAGWVRLGVLLQRMNQDQSAAEAYENVLAMRKRYFTSEEIDLLGEAVTNLAKSYQKMGEAARSLSTLERGTLRFPDNITLWVELGQNYYKQKNFQKALTAFTRAIEINPDDRMAWQGKSQACAELGMKEQEKEANQRLAALGG
jgi:tetratricopeptide (TPR) repeat protein